MSEVSQRFKDALHAVRWRLDLRGKMRPLMPLVDWATLSLTAFGGIHFLGLRRLGLERLPRNRKLLRWLGVYPVRAHYYDPLVDPDQLRRPLDEPRQLPGLDLRVDAQLALLREMRFQDELAEIPLKQTRPDEYGYENGTYFGADGAFLYSMVRRSKPRRIIEVGAGNSTLVIERALARSRDEDASYRCEHICIEPFEMPWLERLGITIVRQKIEDVPLSMFSGLGVDDILFIDSSHMIRPQGDVLHVYQEIFPTLGPGTLVHVHDIFTPRDYPRAWVVDQNLFWNEQYLLEAFMTHNDHFTVVAALNMLYCDHFDRLAAACPILQIRPKMVPSGFWVRRQP